MKKILLTISLLLVAICFAFGQVSYGEFAYGGTGDNFGSSIVQTRDGGYIALGTTSSYGAGSWEIYVIKLDSNFNITWTKTVGGTGGDEAAQIIQTSDGEYAIAGYTESFGISNADVYVIKLDMVGNVKWTRTIGGSGYDYGNALTETYDKGLAIAGSTTSFGAGGYDAYVIKLDSVGNLKWTKTIGGVMSDRGNSILQTPDYGLVIAGSYGGSPSGLYVIKLDSTGTLLWTGVDTTVGTGYSVINTYDKGLAVVGYTGSGFAGSATWTYILKLDSEGIMQWNTMLGDTGTAFDTSRGTLGTSIIQASDSGLIVTGYNYSFDNGNTIGEAELMFMKTDLKGKFMWDTQFDTMPQAFYGNDGYYSVPALCSTKDKGCAAAWLDWGVSKPMKEKIVKLDSNGKSCTGKPFTIYKSSKAFITSAGTVGSGGSITTIDSGRFSSGGTETILCSVAPTSVNTISPPLNSVEVYPNPGNGVFTVAISNYELGISNQKTGVEVYNVLGEKVYSNTFSTLHSQFSIDISNNPPGIYFYRITSEKGDAINSGKLIIEK